VLKREEEEELCARYLFRENNGVNIVFLSDKSMAFFSNGNH